MIVSSGRKVDFCDLSNSLRDIRGLQWLTKGSPVPPGTATAKLSSSLDAVRQARRLTGGCTFFDWFDGGPELDCDEAAVGLGRFEQTLTVLWSGDSIEEQDPDEDSD